MVTVRSRSRQDLMNLKDLIQDVEPIGNAGTDYPWRIRISKEKWAEIVSVFAMETTYPNFKSETGKHDPERAHIYSKVWSALFGIQHQRMAGGGRYPAARSSERQRARRSKR